MNNSLFGSIDTQKNYAEKTLYCGEAGTHRSKLVQTAFGQLYVI
jgi:hypothetical protein